MWERLTEECRRAMYHADEEAKRRGHSVILAEHLLFGILLEPDSQASVSLGVEPREKVLRGVRTMLDGIRSSPTDQLYLWHSGKQVFDYVYGRAAKHKEPIDTEAFLVAIRECPDTTGSKIVAQATSDQGQAAA